MSETQRSVSGVAGKCKKRGRNKKGCDRYRLEDRRLKNKLARVLRHVKRQGACSATGATLAMLKSTLPVVPPRPIFERFGIAI